MHTKQTKAPTPGENYLLNPADLLRRDPIELDPANIEKEIANSIVLITGAAGSIGSELAVQLVSFKPAKIILIDQAETPLNDLHLQLSKQFENIIIESFPANITDKFRMKLIFSDTKPEIVFHTAACKHVPFMENHPYEAILTNVFGAKILADLAISYAVKKFIFISTDKAVKPSSIMGATKRIAEQYIQHLSRKPDAKTHFVITRFGNVLGSNGSFVPLFERQICEGGPITITHPEASRYLMTVSEACQLVLEAGATGQNGAILFFDMGPPIKILDVAKRMILLSAQRAEDIGIQYIGLRPGEKLREELYDDHVKYEQTAHTKILLTRTTDETIRMEHAIPVLKNALQTGKNAAMKEAIRYAVPEYSG